MHETYDYMWWPMENQWVNLPNKTICKSYKNEIGGH